MLPDEGINGLTLLINKLISTKLLNCINLPFERKSIKLNPFKIPLRGKIATWNSLINPDKQVRSQIEYPYNRLILLFKLRRNVKDAFVNLHTDILNCCHLQKEAYENKEAASFSQYLKKCNHIHQLFIFFKNPLTLFPNPFCRLLFVIKVIIFYFTKNRCNTTQEVVS